MSNDDEISEMEEDLGQLCQAIEYEKAKLMFCIYKQEKMNLTIIMHEETLFHLHNQKEEAQKNLISAKGLKGDYQNVANS